MRAVSFKVIYTEVKKLFDFDVDLLVDLPLRFTLRTLQQIESYKMRGFK